MNNQPTSNRKPTIQVIKDFVQYDYRYAHVFKGVPQASLIILFLSFHADKKTNVADFSKKGLTVAQAIEIGLGIKPKRWSTLYTALEEYGALARIKERCNKTGRETKSNSKIVINKHLARKENLVKIKDTYQGQIKAKFPILPDDVAKLFPYKTHSMPFCKFEPLYSFYFPDMPKMTDLLFYLGHHANPSDNVATFKKPVNKQIEEKLGMSANTVNKYLEEFYLSGIATIQAKDKDDDKYGIFLHPHVINKGNNKAEWDLLNDNELSHYDINSASTFRLRFHTK